MGNGARAQQKRERKGKDAGKGAAKSQLKSNAAACEFNCDICKQTFLKTANLTILTGHASDKHGAPPERCFNNLPEETAKEKAKRLAKEAEDNKKIEEEEKKRLAKELLAKQREEEAAKKKADGEEAKNKADGEDAKKKGEEEEPKEVTAEGADVINNGGNGDGEDSKTKEVTDGVAKLDVDGKEDDKKD